MSFLDRIKSIIGETKEKASEVKDKFDESRDALIDKFEEGNIQETWYENKLDSYDVVRVISVETPLHLVKILYRTIQNIQDIDETEHFSPSGEAPGMVYDTRGVIHNSRKSFDKGFKDVYTRVLDVDRVSQLEERYQQVLRDYGTRMNAEIERSAEINPSSSRNRLNSFLRVQEPTPQRAENDDDSWFDDDITEEGESPLPTLSGSTQMNMPNNSWNFMDEARREMNEANAKIGKEPEIKDNSEPEIVLRDKKRLENIE